jgi:hypothetical protein
MILIGLVIVIAVLMALAVPRVRGMLTPGTAQILTAEEAPGRQ